MINNIQPVDFESFPLNSTSTLDDVPKVPRHAFTAKVTFGIQRYTELDIFRQEIEHSQAGLHHQPYTYHKKKILNYKLIFFGFTLLFLLLALVSTKLPTTISCGFFYSSCHLIKGGLLSVCLLFSMGSCIVALSLRTEREAIRQYVRKARTILNAVYTRKRGRLGINGFFTFCSQKRKQAIALKHIYEEALEKISDKKDEALHLIHRIATARTLSQEEREALFNQAIEEFSEKLMGLTHTFRKAGLPHYS